MSSTNYPSARPSSPSTKTKLDLYFIANKIKDNILPFLIFVLVTLFSLYVNKKLSIKGLGLDNKYFVFWLVIIIAFSIYVLASKQVLDDKSQNNRLQNSVRKALVALIIAYFAKLDMVIAPFFLVLIFSYFSDKDWV
jgi:uncharacterized membrane-anchored protein